MASSSAPHAGATIVRRQMLKWALCCVVLLMLTLKGACAKTVLHNRSGRDLLLRLPQAHMIKELAAGKSVELEGAQQQRGVRIQDVESGAVAAPLDLPDNRSLEVVWSSPSSATSTSTVTATRAATRPLFSIPDLLAAKACVPNLLALGIGGARC